MKMYLSNIIHEPTTTANQHYFKQTFTHNTCKQMLPFEEKKMFRYVILKLYLSISAL